MRYRASRHLIVSISVVLLLIVAFILLLPEVARRLAIRQLESQMTVSVALEDVDINLFTGRASVEHLVIGTEFPRPLFTLPRAEIGFSFLRLITGRIDLSDIVLQDPLLVIERLGPDRFNVVEAVRARPDRPDTGGSGLRLDRLRIVRGAIVFIDHTRDPAYELRLSSIDVDAGPIATNLQPQTEAATRFTAGFQVGNGTATLSGSARPFERPAETEVKVKLSDVELRAFAAYLPYGGRLDLGQSVLHAEGRYVLTADADSTVQHRIEADLAIGGVGLLTSPDDRTIARVRGVEARNLRVDLLQNQATVGLLAMAEPYLSVRRDREGFNLGQFFPGPSDGGRQTDTKRSGMPVMIEKIKASGGRIEFFDETMNPGIDARFQDVSIDAERVAVLPAFGIGDMAVEATQSGQGSLRVTGTVSSGAIRGRFDIRGEGLPFAPYRGYLNQLFRNANLSGRLVGGRLNLVLDEQARGVVASIDGTLEGRDLALRLPEREDPFLTAERLGVDLRSVRMGAETSVDIGTIQLIGANLSVLRDRDGRLNVTRLWASGPGDQPARSPELEKESGTPVAIRSIVVEQSRIEILDRSVSPNYKTELRQVRGRLSDLRPMAKRSNIELQGILDSGGLSLTGWLTPYADKLHLEGSVERYSLPRLNPYATEFISHRIQRGQITTDVSYTLEGDVFHVKTELVLRDLRLGERTGNQFEQQVGIPLELAIALLQDIHGVIRLQVTMSQERKFSVNIAGLIWDAVRNAIVRSVTAPFRWIGRVFTSGNKIEGVRIEPVLFGPGSRRVLPQSAKQLADLSELLKQKPSLGLRLSGKAGRDEVEEIKQTRFWAMIESAPGKSYEEALVSVYRRLGGLARPRFPLPQETESDLEQFVLRHIEVGEEELRALAAERALIVEDELQRRGVDPKRLFSAADDWLTDATAAVEFQLIAG